MTCDLDTKEACEKLLDEDHFMVACSVCRSILVADLHPWGLEQVPMKGRFVMEFNSGHPDVHERWQQRLADFSMWHLYCWYGDAEVFIDPCTGKITHE